MAFDASEARDSQGRWVKVHFAGEERLVHAVPVRSKPHMLIASEGHFVGTAGAGKAKHPVRPFLLQKGDHWEVLQQVNVRNRPGRVTGFGEAKTNERNNRKADLATPKYRTIDLTGDGHGHHIPGTPLVYSHGWHLVKGGQTTTKSTSVVSLVDKKGRLKKDPGTLRVYRKVTQEKRMELFKDAGLNLAFANKSEVELDAMWRDPHTPETERAALEREIKVRMKRLEVVSQSWEQAFVDTARESQRDVFRRWDNRLRRLPGGKALIDLRERLLSDHVLDKVEPLRQWMHEKGHEYTKHVATAVAIGMLLHPLGIGFAGLALGDAGAHAAEALLSSLYVHAGLAVALARPVEKIIGPFLRPFSREAKIARAKRRVAKAKRLRADAMRSDFEHITRPAAKASMKAAAPTKKAKAKK